MLVRYINVQKLHPYLRSISLLVAIVTTGFVLFICKLKIIYVFVCKYADFAYFYCMYFFPEARIFLLCLYVLSTVSVFINYTPTIATCSWCI